MHHLMYFQVCFIEVESTIRIDLLGMHNADASCKTDTVECLPLSPKSPLIGYTGRRQQLCAI